MGGPYDWTGRALLNMRGSYDWTNRALFLGIFVMSGVCVLDG